MRTYRFRTPKADDRARLDFIKELPCLICGHPGTDPAHVRMSDASIGKVNPGIGRKPADYFTNPLCRMHHDLQHSMNEESFWTTYGIDGVKTSLAINACFPDHEAAMRVVEAVHNNFSLAQHTREGENV